jgi:hypothetical protein
LKLIGQSEGIRGILGRKTCPFACPVRMVASLSNIVVHLFNNEAGSVAEFWRINTRYFEATSLDSLF